MTWTGIKIEDVKEMDFRPDETLAYELRSGDILLAEASGSPSEVGKPAIWRDEIPGACFQNTLIRVRAPALLVPFLYRHFLNDAISGRFSKASRGVGIHHIGAQALSEWRTLIPPLGEQERISEALDSHLTRLDAANDGLKRVEANLKRYRASVLKAAVEGRLVPTEAWLARREGRDYEPASVLLERILIERRRRWSESGKNGGYQEPSPPDTTNLPALPEGWTWTTADAACEQVVDCHNKTAPYVEDGIPLLRTTNIREGSLKLDELRFVSEETYGFWSRRCPPLTDDVLFTREAPMGEAALVPEGMRVCMGQRMMLLRANPQLVLPRYLLLAVQAPHVRQYATRRAVGIGVQHLRVRDVEGMPIPLAPVAEQRRIVAEAERQ